LFFASALVWSAVAIAVWYMFVKQAGGAVGLPPLRMGSSATPDLSIFWSGAFLWFDLYFAACVAIFAAVWMTLAPAPWAHWSILCSALIVFANYVQVEASVAINVWYGPFYNLIQAALSRSSPVTIGQFYGEIASLAGIAAVAVVVGALTRFLVSH